MRRSVTASSNQYHVGGTRCIEDVEKILGQYRVLARSYLAKTNLRKKYNGCHRVIHTPTSVCIFMLFPMVDATLEEILQPGLHPFGEAVDPRTAECLVLAGRADPAGPRDWLIEARPTTCREPRSINGVTAAPVSPTACRSHLPCRTSAARSPTPCIAAAPPSTNETAAHFAAMNPHAEFHSARDKTRPCASDDFEPSRGTCPRPARRIGARCCLLSTSGSSRSRTSPSPPASAAPPIPAECRWVTFVPPIDRAEVPDLSF